MAELLDSGTRRQFDTGAVRDIAEGKGRCDLLHDKEIERLNNCEVRQALKNVI